MKKDIVLAKLFKTNEILRGQKEKNSDKDGKNKLNSKLNHSGKSLLCNLLDNDGINQRNLASLLSVSPQAVSESIKKLELNNLIRKEAGSQKNENLIFLTDFGRERSLELREKIHAHANMIFADFSDDELSQLYSLLDKIV